jgi:hypothetical protein
MDGSEAPVNATAGVEAEIEQQGESPPWRARDRCGSGRPVRLGAKAE